VKRFGKILNKSEDPLSPFPALSPDVFMHEEEKSTRKPSSQ
jgi:hypothetical protein